MTHFATKMETETTELDELKIKRALERVEKAGRFPVQGGDFLPTNRKGWFDSVPINQQVQKTTSKVAK